VTEEPLVSVVTPIYNGASYLTECIDSLLAQTHTNWECLVVDNASTDATPEIAEAYAKRESRVRHLRFDEFVDATANHNRAFDTIDRASEFCKVLQADDWLYPSCLSEMARAAGVSSTVGLVSAYQLRDRHVALFGLPYRETFVRGRDLLRRQLLGHFQVTGGPTAHMFRSSLVRERRPFFRPGFRHDDTEAVYAILAQSDFAFVHQLLTFAREQPGARYAWSQTMFSSGSENIVFLLRYGGLNLDGEPVIDEVQRRARLRWLLRRYVWWHVRQFPRVSRMRDQSFFEFHSLKRRQILEEANGDPEVVTAMAVVGGLLLRGSLVPERKSDF
jgi:glycosyltransferase involved in cell wall biosynthesis